MYPSTAEEGIQLFHRAIVLRDADAWGELHARYRTVMCAWARRNLLFEASQTHCEDIADEALERAWLALTPECFQSFAGLPALLAYLRACVASAVIDSARKQQFSDRVGDDPAEIPATPFEEPLVEQLDRAELWELVNSLLKSDTERLVLHERFVLDLRPREIQARHPGVFPNINLVYTTQRNLCDRLGRHPALAAYAPNRSVE